MLPESAASNTTNIDIVIAGCGAMGLPMARCLLANGFNNVHGYDIRPVHEFGDFSPRLLPSTRAAAEHDLVLTVVRDWLQTESLCFGKGGLFDGEVYPRTLVVCSTLSPRLLEQIEQRVPDDVELVDAPMSGAPYRAANGTLTFMLGGKNETIEHLMPVFRAMGSHIHHLGRFGKGMTCKVLNNLLAASSTRAVRELIGAAEALDFPVDTLLDVARTSSGASWFGDNFHEIDWAREGYGPNNTIGILEKDVTSLMHALEEFPELPIHDQASQIIKGLRKLTNLS